MALPKIARAFIEDVRRALYCSKLISYAQGYMLLREAAKEQGWNLNMGGIALMWRGGCIIRSRFLGKIKEAYDKNPQLTNLLLDDFFSTLLNDYQASWRRGIIKAIEFGVPTPAFSTALSFYDGYRTERLPANLLQAQRDFFGAHTYERVDKPRGEFFHTNWTGRGGRVSHRAVITPDCRQFLTHTNTEICESNKERFMKYGLNIRQDGALDFVSIGGLVHRLDPGIIPFRKATECQIHVSGGNLMSPPICPIAFGLQTGVASAMVNYPIGDLIAERVAPWV